MGAAPTVGPALLQPHPEGPARASKRAAEKGVAPVVAALLDAGRCRGTRRRRGGILGYSTARSFSGQRHPSAARCTCCGDGQKACLAQQLPLRWMGWP